MAAFPAPFQDHSFRKKIDLDATLVSADKTDFDIVVSITDTDLRDEANANGFDIQFADVNDVLLDFEIQTWIPATGRLVAWVKVPSLSSSVDTELRMYYGKAAATDVSDPAGVWSDWEAVYHLQESGSGSQGEYVNSVGNGHDAGGGFDGTSFGVNTTPTRDGGTADVPPWADHYQDWPGPQSDDTNIGCLGAWPEHQSPGPWESLTSFVWYAQSTSVVDGRLWGLTFGTGASDQTVLQGNFTTGTGIFRVRLTTDEEAVTTDFAATNNDDSWNLSIFTADMGPSPNEGDHYLDGAFDASTGGYFGVDFGISPSIDYRTIGNAGEVFSRSPRGGIAEVRLKEAVADADDVSIWWENQSAPGAFHTINAQEENSAIVGNAAGITVADGALIGHGFMATDAAGITVVAGALIGRVQLIGSAAGITVAAGVLVGVGQSVGAAAGSTIAAGVIIGRGQMVASVEGTSGGTTVVAGILTRVAVEFGLAVVFDVGLQKVFVQDVSKL